MIPCNKVLNILSTYDDQQQQQQQYNRKKLLPQWKEIYIL